MVGKVQWAKPVEAYSLLFEDDPEEAVFKSRKGNLSKRGLAFIVLSAIFAGFFLGCLTNGRAWAPATGKDDVISCKCRNDTASINNMPLTESISVDKYPKVLTYNRTFSENSHKTDAAWESIFPKQGGYFSHPTIAPTRATFSVFHYLHCLVSI